MVNNFASARKIYRESPFDEQVKKQQIEINKQQIDMNEFLKIEKELEIRDKVERLYRQRKISKDARDYKLANLPFTLNKLEKSVAVVDFDRPIIIGGSK